MATYPKCKVAEGTLSLVQINAAAGVGTVIVPEVAGKTITVVDAWFRALGGTMGGATAIVLEDTAGTDVLSVTVGTLTNGAIIRGGITNATATNFGTALGKGKGLRIGRTNSDATTATNGMDYVVLYKVDSD